MSEELNTEIHDNLDMKFARQVGNKSVNDAVSLIESKLSMKIYDKLMNNLFSRVYVDYDTEFPIDIQILGEEAYMTDNRTVKVEAPKSIPEGIMNLLKNLNAMLSVMWMYFTGIK